MKSHVYGSIDGWFDFEDIYAEQVRQADEGARFVEIGAWLGRSTAFMAVEIANSGKRIEFNVVDTWKGSPNEPYHLDLVAANGGCLFAAFMNNMRAAGVEHVVRPLRITSREAVGLFPDDSLDFVFVDGCHEFAEVRADVCDWRRKVKPGGVLAGHDIYWQGLQQAVQDVLPWSEVSIRNSSWFWVKDSAMRGRWLREGRHHEGGNLPSHLLYIPCAACPELLVNAVRSIWSSGVQLVIFDSSRDGLDWDALPIPAAVEVFRADWPISFTQLQNRAQLEARIRRVKWLVFMHADAACADERVLSDLLRYAENRSATNHLAAVLANYDALCAFSVEALHDVGAWDETFEWYYSDSDYYRRLRSRGWLVEDWPDRHRVLHKISASIKNDPELARLVHQRSEYSHAHYLHKWGGPPGEEVYSIPYNGHG